MPGTVPLDPDALLTTTRSVRRRLDLTRPVGRDVIEECLRVAQQAPTASNLEALSFVVVTDESTRAALADIYRRGWEIYVGLPIAACNVRWDDPVRQAGQERVSRSAQHLADHLHEVPAMVIPCIRGRSDGMPTVGQATQFGSVLPAAWSFMLAARARGLASAWTSIHLFFEREAADLLGIPFDEVMQAALIPVAHTLGDGFSPAARLPVESVVHWEGWSS